MAHIGSRKLSNENINAAANEAQQFLSEVNVDGKDIISIRLAMEEALLNYQGL